MLRIAGVLLIMVLAAAPMPAAEIPFIRGDANVDGHVNLADGIWLLQYLYLGGPASECLAAMDANADGDVDLADATVVIGFRLLDGRAPDYPFPYCGISAIGECDSYLVCPPIPELTVTRDELGVWFIEGGDQYQLYEAFGYEIATDRLWQSELFRRLSSGRLTEILGAGQLNTDIAINILGYSDQEMLDGFDGISELGQLVVLAYIDGMNRRIAEVIANPDLLPYEFHQLGFMPDPWTIQDVMALQVTLLRNFDSEALSTHQLDNALLLAELIDEHPLDGGDMFDDLRWLDDPEAPTMIPPEDFSIPFQGGAAPAQPLPQQYQVENLRALRDRVQDVFAGTAQRLSDIGSPIRLGSYAWVVSGDHTDTGNPILYSGPQMEFSAPGIIVEGSLRGAGIDVSGMALAGLPGIIIGRTPRHAWSGQVAHPHTVDIYLDDADDLFLHRVETIPLGNNQFLDLPVYRTQHGPVVAPLILDPSSVDGPVASWKYSHWGKELNTIDVNLDFIMARNIDDFGDAMDRFCVGLHVCYADRRGNVGYWMAGLDPERSVDADPRLPQLGDGSMEWTEPVTYKPRKTVRNPQRGWIGGWNNKAGGGPAGGASPGHAYGRFHRAHAMQDRIAEAIEEGPLSFEFLRELAPTISSTDCCNLGSSGGNRWFFVRDAFVAAIESDPDLDRLDALALLGEWDGYFVPGGPDAWTTAEVEADAWTLQDRWIRRVLQLTFEDELDTESLQWNQQGVNLLFNVFLRALPGSETLLQNRINWFMNRGLTPKPTDAAGIIVQALDDTLAQLGPRPWDQPRANISFTGQVVGEVWTTPWLDRSTYTQVVELGPQGPVRIESMIPLGQSGMIYQGPTGEPLFDEFYFGFTEIFDGFQPRSFPTFESER
ncbi:MAG: penicillin acylase family protein [Planctomycetota bacterium]|nr:penicillin acylase family protein [Planctomycetota bacterium]